MRIKGLRTGIVVVALALGLLLPGIAAAGGGPTATKSGALVNYVSTGKLKIGKTISIVIVCSTDCNVDTTTVVKGPRFKDTENVSGPLTANVPGGPFFKPNGPLLKGMKAHPGKYTVNSRVTATSLTTGAVETESRTFKLKR
ncbi:MAG: hypothetical protein ACRDK5_04015 [Solirubrobacterales bacterium]